MPELYYVIVISDGSYPTVQAYTKDILEDRLNDQHWGENLTIYPELPSNLEYAEPGIVIIKGKTVVPKAEKVVLKNRLP